MNLSRTLKPCTALLLLFILILSCKKHKPKEDPVPTPPEENPNVYQSIFSSPTVQYCGSVFTSNLKIKDGTDIGTVSVYNDSLYLYLTYQLNGNWYIGAAHSYAGKELTIPRNIDGNPMYQQFPGKETLNYCDLRQAFTFRASLSALGKDNSAQ